MKTTKQEIEEEIKEESLTDRQIKKLNKKIDDDMEKWI